MNSSGFTKQLDNILLSRTKLYELIKLVIEAAKLPGGEKVEVSISINSQDGQSSNFVSEKDFIDSNQEYDDVKNIFVRATSIKFNSKKLKREGSSHFGMRAHFSTPYLGLEITGDTTHVTNAYNDLIKTIGKLNSKKYRTWNEIPNSILASTIFSLVSAGLMTLLYSSVFPRTTDIANYSSILLLVYIVSFGISLTVTEVLSKKYNSVVLADGSLRTSRTFKSDVKFWLGYIFTNILLQIVF